MMKKEFVSAKIEIIRFENIDIITASNPQETMTIEIGGQDAINPPSNPPVIPFP